MFWSSLPDARMLPLALNDIHVIAPVCPKKGWPSSFLEITSQKVIVPSSFPTAKSFPSGLNCSMGPTKKEEDTESAGPRGLPVVRLNSRICTFLQSLLQTEAANSL